MSEHDISSAMPRENAGSQTANRYDYQKDYRHKLESCRNLGRSIASSKGVIW